MAALALGGLVECVDWRDVNEDPQLPVAKLHPGAGVKLVLLAAMWHKLAPKVGVRCGSLVQDTLKCARVYNIRVERAV